MPDEAMWDGFFNPVEVLQALGLRPGMQRVVDFGSGYGTFSLPAGKIIGSEGEVIGLDIESELVELCQKKAADARILNARFEYRDFVADGSGLADESVDFVMLFNILHAEQPGLFLKEAHRILSPRGILAVMHWNHDANTPRGPSMEIRPRPETCRTWVRQGGFFELSAILALPPWHYGFTAKPDKNQQI